MLIQFTPPEFASLNGIHATFPLAGTGELQMHAGSQREYLAITVLE